MTNNLSAALPVTNPALSPDLQNKTGAEFLQAFIPSLVGFILLIGAIIFFFMILIGAIRWTASGGDKAAVESAKGTITNALIGLFLVFSVFAVVKLLELFFGINILTLDIGVLKIQ